MADSKISDLLRLTQTYKNSVVSDNETRTPTEAAQGFFDSIGDTISEGASSIRNKFSQFKDEFAHEATQALQDSFPNSELKDRYSIEKMVYPTEIQSLESKIKHWVTFYISEVAGAKFEKTETTITPEERDARLGEGYQATKRAEYKGLWGEGSGKVDTEKMISEATSNFAKGAGFGAVLGSALNLAKGKSGVEGFVSGGVSSAVVMSTSQLLLRPKTEMLKKSISIYMPDTVMTTQSHLYQEHSMNRIQGIYGAAAQIAQSTDIMGSVDAVFKGAESGKGIQTALETVKSSPGALETLGRVAEATDIVGEGFMDALLRNQGKALNQQVELFFQGTERREFQFDFRFTARSQAEANQIQAIIKAFRYHSAPALPNTEQNNRYFVVPSQFNIKFMFNGESGPVENDKIAKIGTCVLERVDVNYVGSGKFVTFEDGQPVDIEVRLMFREIDIMTREAIEAGY